MLSPSRSTTYVLPKTGAVVSTSGVASSYISRLDTLFTHSLMSLAESVQMTGTSFTSSMSM